MDLRDLLRAAMRPCPAQQVDMPHWRCNLHAGHTGPHCSIRVTEFSA